MKTAINKFRIAIFSWIIFCTFSTVAPTFASAITETSTVSKPGVDLQYIGKWKTYPTFQLKLDNSEDQEFEVTIKDADGVVLYRENVKGQQVVRKYGLDVDPDELYSILIVIRNKSKAETQVYQVTKASYPVECLSVARL